MQIASFARSWWDGPLAAGGSYDRTVTFRLPGDAEGRFYLIAFTDSDVYGQLPGGAATVGVSQVQVVPDHVPEFRDEGNNTKVVPMDVTLAPAADLRVTSVVVPERATRGQMLRVTYTVTNTGGAATPANTPIWRDRVYLSADSMLDTAADRYLGEIDQTKIVPANGGSTVVAANGGSYTVTADFRLPRELTGSFYVFVQTDPVSRRRSRAAGCSRPGSRTTTASPSPLPVLIELPPPSDLVVDSIVTAGHAAPPASR